MNRRILVRLTAVLAALVLLFTGCSLDVESFLQPPRAQGEQQAIQAALETYLRDSGLATSRYTLRYPSEGEYTSAFIQCDEQGRPTDAGGARATLAVAFYSLSAAPEETHVNLLRREDEEWVSVGDSVGYGADILQVSFGDLEGDGARELLTGWSTYNSKDHRLAVFAMGEELKAISSDRVYTQLYVGDITAAGHDSLLLLRIGSGNDVTATLERMSRGQLVGGGTVRLDGYIQQFGSMTLCRLAEGVHGLYVDAVKNAGTTITELICFDDRGLHAPFYDAVANVTTATARATGLAAMDVDGDGLVEIPHCRLLPGYTEEKAAATTAWLTTWRVWDYATGQWNDRLQAVVNTTDNYMVTLDETQRDVVTTVYDAATRTLDLQHTDTDRVWLRLCAADTQAEAPTSGMEPLTLFAAAEERAGCIAWYDPAVIEEEKVRYMVVRLSDGKGE